MLKLEKSMPESVHVAIEKSWTNIPQPPEPLTRSDFVILVLSCVGYSLNPYSFQWKGFTHKVFARLWLLIERLDLHSHNVFPYFSSVLSSRTNSGYRRYIGEAVSSMKSEDTVFKCFPKIADYLKNAQEFKAKHPKHRRIDDLDVVSLEAMRRMRDKLHAEEEEEEEDRNENDSVEDASSSESATSSDEDSSGSSSDKFYSSTSEKSQDSGILYQKSYAAAKSSRNSSKRIGSIATVSRESYVAPTFESRLSELFETT
jgi:hypothetical protein